MTTGKPPTNPFAWLRRVTVNLAIDAIRARKKRTRQAQDSRPEASVPGHVDDLVKQETAQRIATALQSLTERQRSVVVAKVYDGCTFAQNRRTDGPVHPDGKSHYLRALRALGTKLARLQTESGADHGM